MKKKSVLEIELELWLCKNSSLKKISLNQYEFKITDNENDLSVFYQGILPDLFREGQGTVIEGLIENQSTINALRVYAKHDENYMPASIKEELEKNNQWKKIINDFISGFFFIVFINIVFFFGFGTKINHQFKNKIFLYNLRSSTLLICVSFLSLMTAYITSDFSNFNVFQNSHSDKPLIYKISGTWGNHEGSILLWLSMISIYGFLYSL